MKTIDELRNEINTIDKKMALLFSERMDIALDIGNIKQNLKLPIFDSTREKSIVKENIQYVNEAYQELYIDFINKVLELSKKLQNKGK